MQHLIARRLSPPAFARHLSRVCPILVIRSSASIQFLPLLAQGLAPPRAALPRILREATTTSLSTRLPTTFSTLVSITLRERSRSTAARTLALEVLQASVWCRLPVR